MLKRYPCAEIEKETYEISEFGGTSCFLLIGKERTALIDTGIGIGDLLSFVRTLTDKPILVFLTHNHRDHVGNAPLFSDVHLNEADRALGPIVRPWTNKESRVRYAKSNCTDTSFGFFWDESDLQEYTVEPTLMPFDDGMTFDLGERICECHHCPGHTPGSMTVIDRNTGILFCGDVCNNLVGIGVRPIPGVRPVSMERAYSALSSLYRMDFDKKKVFNGHPDFRTMGKPLSEHVMPAVVEGMRQIVQGDYVLHREWIRNIDSTVDTAAFGDVRIQFQAGNIRESKEERA